MKTRLDFMRRTSFKTLAFGIAILSLASASYADWVAFNDNIPGPSTAPNTTTNNIRLQTSSLLKEIVTGTNLPVTLSITHSATDLVFISFGQNPFPNTPLYNVFNTFVTFGSVTPSVPDVNVEITNTLGTVTYTFTGLNPSKRYTFTGGAARGLSLIQGSNRWTRVEIVGAASFANAHTTNVVTSAQAPADLTASQVAVNFAVNNVAGTGDIVSWENIDPGPDGSFAIVNSRYTGFVPNNIIPNGGHSNGGTNYAITGIRLEELGTGPPVIITQPQDRSVSPGQTATFSVLARGEPPLRYQWYRSGSLIAGATNSSYTTPPTTINDYGARFSVTVYNKLGSVTSSDGVLIVALQPIVIMPLTNTWKYDQSGTDLGTAWQAVDYNDSAWPSGRGVLALETDNQIVLPLTNTVLSLRNGAGTFVDTFYFRTHFDVPSDPQGITLTTSNLIDDGAVFYLNGEEIYRQNIVSAPTRVNYKTLASSSLEAVWTSLVLPTALLVQGDNVLAVEVHQGSETSSDVVWGMSIRGDFPGPSTLAIVSSPSDRSVSESANTTFTVGITGTQPFFRWYKWVNDLPVAISGATRQSYTITNVALADAGYYSVVVSNAINAVISAPAFLTVSADLSGPTLIAADGTLNGSNVVVSFSEFVTAATATNIGNYKVTNVTSGGTLTITKAVLDKGTNVILTTSTSRGNDTYLLIVNNVQDISTRHNVITPNSSIPITALITVLALGQAGWDFYNPLLGPPSEPFYPGPNWNQLNFVFNPPETDTWGHNAAALFVYDIAGEDLPGPHGTSISPVNSYFRYSFVLNASPVGASFRFRHVVDDGAIFYFNGTEVARFNMPNGPVNETTIASTPIAVASSSDYIDIPQALVRGGTNLFAAEAHVISNTDTDMVYGVEILAEVGSFASGPVIITGGPSDLTAQEGQSVTFSFNGVGAGSFQWKTNGAPIPGANQPVLTIPSLPLSWNGKLISVTASNATSSATSTNARLTVLNDTIPPFLISALAVSPTSVSVAFSEPITALTATNPANYKVTNSAGPNLTVSGATLSNGTNVTLTVSPFSAGSYTLVVNGIHDASVSGNLILSNSTSSIGYHLNIPINATWRFFTNNVDLGTNWRTVGYADTLAPWSSGPGLIADETAALPEPILTHISRLDNGTYHYTFYFRYHFTAPSAAPADVTFRHVIDDGCVMYINNQEFHRFNMPNGTVDWMTQGTTAIGDAVYNGPYTTIFTNLIAGDNVIAVEVHQSGTASSDITFGATFDISVGSTTTIPIPRVQIAKSGTNVVVSWPGSPVPLVLERKTLLSPTAVWAPVTNQGPITVSPGTSGNQQFWHLHRK